jgi:hypothetical protein
MAAMIHPSSSVWAIAAHHIRRTPRLELIVSVRACDYANVIVLTPTSAMHRL